MPPRLRPPRLQVWDRLGLDAEERLSLLGPMEGTHAHEMTMAVQQLYAQYDQQAGDEDQVRVAPGGDCCLPGSSLLGFFNMLWRLCTHGPCMHEVLNMAEEHAQPGDDFRCCMGGSMVACACNIASHEQPWAAPPNQKVQAQQVQPDSKGSGRPCCQ